RAQGPCGARNPTVYKGAAAGQRSRMRCRPGLEPQPRRAGRRVRNRVNSHSIGRYPHIRRPGRPRGTLMRRTPRTHVSALRSTPKRVIAALGTSAALALGTIADAQPPGPPGHQFSVVTVAEGLVNPWSIAW